jgi:hypothetical protein
MSAALSTRMDHWASPTYLHPWYMSFDDAVKMWHDPRLDFIRQEARAREGW